MAAFFGTNVDTSKIEQLLSLADKDTQEQIKLLLLEVVAQLRILTEIDLDEIKPGEDVNL